MISRLLLLVQDETKLPHQIQHDTALTLCDTVQLGAANGTCTHTGTQIYSALLALLELIDGFTFKCCMS